MTSVTVNAYLTDEETELVMSLCRSFGRAELVPESLIDAVIGVSGSAPAYVLCLLKQWQMRLWLEVCHVNKPMSLQHKP